jgi:hypothetical protein
LARKLETEVMNLTQTFDQYACKKKLLARRLSQNGVSIPESKIRKCIIRCLPWQFDAYKATLTASLLTANLDGVLAAIKALAVEIKFNDQLPRTVNLANLAANLAVPGAAGHPPAGRAARDQRRPPPSGRE